LRFCLIYFIRTILANLQAIIDMRYLTVLILVFLSMTLNAQTPIPGESFIGRWDLTMTQGENELPSWLEISKSGHSTLIGRFVYAFGSARPIAHVMIDGDQFSFSIPNQWEAPGRMSFTGQKIDGGLIGTMTYVDGKTYNWKGVRAPLLERTDVPIWGTTQSLFNGKNMDGWHVKGQSQWKVEDGTLINMKSGGNLFTDEVFNDFMLRVVFRYPEGSNSGIYLRGRHEVQIEDNYGKYPSSLYFGGIYGFLTPNQMAAKPAGQWQEYKITLVGRRVSVVANGKAIITDQIIPGITGGAIDSDEGAPGPIFIQGDHGPIEFKVVEITPALN